MTFTSEYAERNQATPVIAERFYFKGAGFCFRDSETDEIVDTIGAWAAVFGGNDWHTANHVRHILTQRRPVTPEMLDRFEANYLQVASDHVDDY
jgi:hypothetical protein